MSQIREPVARSKQTLATLYESIHIELEQVESRLRAELVSEHSGVQAVLKHGLRLGGKRLRPALLLLAGQAVGPLTDDHITLAAVVEMIHTATLVHDDVLDEAVIRRHVDTVNARWNNETSVLLGDFLFTHAFYMASTLESTDACRTIGRATNIVCDGELRQTLSRGDTLLSEEDYRTIIGRKTAELCACCCQLGAQAANAETDTVQELASFGHALGIAFQITDDLLDLEGDEQNMGKSLGTDLAKQKMTLPLIHARDHLQPTEQKEFLDLLGKEGPIDREELFQWLGHHDSLAYARSEAQQAADRAASHLACLAPSAAKETLLAIAKFVVARQM